MNKQSAVDAMLTGKKVSHPSFDKSGYIFILNNVIYDTWFQEMSVQEFIIRDYPDWNDGWFVIKIPFVKPMPFKIYRKKLNKNLEIRH